MDMTRGYIHDALLSALWQPQRFLSAPKDRRPFQDRTIIHGLVKAMTSIPTNATFEITDVTPLGTILASGAKHWILAGRAPVPAIPDWSMRLVFWIKDGRLQLIPSQERAPGYRNHPGLGSHIDQGYLRLHPTLDRFLAGTDNISAEEQTEDFASWINDIRIIPSTDDEDKQGMFANVSTRLLRTFILGHGDPPIVLAP